MTPNDLNEIMSSQDMVILGKSTKINLILRFIIPLSFDMNGNPVILKQFKRIYNLTNIQDIGEATKFNHTDMDVFYNIDSYFYELLENLNNQGYTRMYLPSLLVEI